MSDIAPWPGPSTPDSGPTNSPPSPDTGTVMSDVMARDKSLDILSHNDYLTTLFVLNCVIKPVIVAVGVPSNVINCLVFWRQGLRDRMNVCLLTLSSVDLCLLLVACAYGVCFYLGLIDPVRWSALYTYLEAQVTGVNHGFRTASACITMVIAIERCLCVVFPLKAATLIRTCSMAGIMVCIVCGTQVAFFTMPATYIVVREDNGTQYGLSKSELFVKNRWFTIWESIVMMSVVPIVTFVVVTLTTGLTVVKLRAAATWRKKTRCSSEKGRQHNGLTKMLVLASCVYILTAIPWVIVFVAMLTVDGYTLRGQYSNSLLTSLAVVHHLPYINCSLHFWVYRNRSSRFRKDVAALFRTSYEQRKMCST